MFSPIIQKSFATAAAGVWVVGSTCTVFAEGKRTKLSIYDEPEPKVVIVESPTKLEEQVYIAQKYANETMNEGKTRVDTLVKKYQDIENKVTTQIVNTIDQQEDLFPNLFYVGVAALGGTILARKRNIVLRFLTSTALAVGTSYYLLPKTTQNVAVRLEQFEKRFPQLVAIHQNVHSSVKDARQQVDTAVAQLRGIDTFKEENKFEQVKRNVENMYTTRSKPGVDETLRKENE